MLKGLLKNWQEEILRNHKSWKNPKNHKIVQKYYEGIYRGRVSFYLQLLDGLEKQGEVTEEEYKSYAIGLLLPW